MKTANVRVRLKGTETYLPTVPARPGSAGKMQASGDGATPQDAPQPHQGASVTRRMAGWRPTGAGPISVVQGDQPELVRRSRDLARNNPQARRALSLYGTHIVGTGMKPRWLTGNAYLRDALHEKWEEWAPYADADGVLCAYGMQALAVNEMAEGGESWGRFRMRRRSDGLPVPLQVQLIPVEQVPLNYSLPNGNNTVVQAIERNAIGQRVAVWMYRAHPGDPVPMRVMDGSTLVRVPFGDALQLYNVARIGQLRGLPWLAPCMTVLQQVGIWQDASVMRKQILTMMVGFVRKVANGGVSAEELAQKWGEIQEEIGDMPGVSLEPGTLQYLDLGEEVQFTNWQETAGADEIFLRSSFQAVAAAADQVYEELTGDWKNTNDRTYRANFATFKRRARQWQFHLLAHQFVRPIVRRWVDVAVGSGAVKVPKSVPDADLYRVTYVPERWEYLNPKQDVEAVTMEIDNGLTARSVEVAARGDDAEVVDALRAADQQREQRLKIARQPATKKPTEPDPAEQDHQP
ncbi:phage portal protein [Azospirillum rugosum]|uniref:Lambda family phage portal protein n=1 Tax=Azospirillum rugosum TaxID=416170 RepID=A0ABS4SGE1_9PROT|nr:phage portal protein [Azospirillum rugosum]MBP2291037.1 lambda family phage portal protein [Azospirillum rugosum]MDQ0524899.1 lambda family phage portal protein [Azospirillum rugosum]